MESWWDGESEICKLEMLGCYGEDNHGWDMGITTLKEESEEGVESVNSELHLIKLHRDYLDYHQSIIVQDLETHPGHPGHFSFLHCSSSFVLSPSPSVSLFLSLLDSLAHSPPQNLGLR